MCVCSVCMFYWLLKIRQNALLSNGVGNGLTVKPRFLRFGSVETVVDCRGLPLGCQATPSTHRKRNAKN